VRARGRVQARAGGGPARHRVARPHGGPAAVLRLRGPLGAPHHAAGAGHRAGGRARGHPHRAGRLVLAPPPRGAHGAHPRQRVAHHHRQAAARVRGGQEYGGGDGPRRPNGGQRVRSGPDCCAAPRFGRLCRRPPVGGCRVCRGCRAGGGALRPARRAPRVQRVQRGGGGGVGQVHGGAGGFHFGARRGLPAQGVQHGDGLPAAAHGNALCGNQADGVRDLCGHGGRAVAPPRWLQGRGCGAQWRGGVRAGGVHCAVAGAPPPHPAFP
jgi:hypothetical protein